MKKKTTNSPAMENPCPLAVTIVCHTAEASVEEVEPCVHDRGRSSVGGGGLAGV